MSSVPGLEHLENEGWEIVRYDFVSRGECYVGNDDTVWKWDGFGPSAAKHIIIRKIEKPKQYRPFANKAEYAPHRDRWIVFKSRAGNGNYSSYLPTSFDDEQVVIGGSTEDYDEAFRDYGFDNFDGTTEPFGVEVTE